MGEMNPKELERILNLIKSLLEKPEGSRDCQQLNALSTEVFKGLEGIDGVSPYLNSPEYIAHNKDTTIKLYSEYYYNKYDYNGNLEKSLDDLKYDLERKALKQLLNEKQLNYEQLNLIFRTLS